MVYNTYDHLAQMRSSFLGPLVLFLRPTIYSLVFLLVFAALLCYFVQNDDCNGTKIEAFDHYRQPWIHIVSAVEDYVLFSFYVGRCND